MRVFLIRVPGHCPVKELERATAWTTVQQMFVLADKHKFGTIDIDSRHLCNADINNFAGFPRMSAGVRVIFASLRFHAFLSHLKIKERISPISDRR